MLAHKKIRPRSLPNVETQRLVSRRNFLRRLINSGFANV